MSDQATPNSETSSASSAPPSLQSLTVPPYQNAAQVHVGVNVHEISVLFGRARLAVDQTTNLPSSFSPTEWFSALSLTPTAAKNLHAALGNALRYYERTYTKIADDPSFKLTELVPEP